ncbi:MAG: helix-turn-helix domain-containing protein [Faecousia sp.]
MMGLSEIRKSRKLTQKELAQRSGVNFRSLQDYEQGHKKLTSASGDILLRLSTVLGCTAEDLLMDDLTGASLLPSNRLDINIIQGQRFYCEKYQTSGRWICSNNRISTLFYYNGVQYMVPFKAVFTPAMLPCLMEAAVLQMEAKIEDVAFQTSGFESW